MALILNGFFGIFCFVSSNRLGVSWSGMVGCLLMIGQLATIGTRRMKANTNENVPGFFGLCLR